MIFHKLDRREFFKWTGITASSSMLFGIQAQSDENSSSFKPDLFLEITPEDKVKIICHRSEMGTGIKSSLPMIIADELEADWTKVEVIQGLGDKRYGSQNTDGSRSIRNFYDKMRQVGASAGLMLELTAAKKWHVPVRECHRKVNKVYYKNKALSYGELCSDAAKLAVPDEKNLKYKKAKDRRYVGKAAKNVDIDDIVTGKAAYGNDVRLPNMLFATIQRCPVVGGDVKSYNKEELENMASVLKTHVIPNFTPPPVFQPQGGIAIFARDSWSAIKARESLKVEWNLGPNKDFNTKDYRKYLEAQVKKPGTPKRTRGNYAKIAEDTPLVKADYYTPFMAHRPMEPPVSTAHFHDGICELWTPTQNPQAVQSAVAAALGIKEEQVYSHVTLLGGGFGRKGQVDFAVESALLSKEMNCPVQVVWTREDDVQHCYYHAAAAIHLEATLNEKKYPEGLLMRTAFPGIASTFVDGALYDNPTILGMNFTDIPYDIPNLDLQVCDAPAHVRIGWLRSVSNIQHAFATSSFTDELARKANIDPVVYLNKLLGPDRHVDLKKDKCDYPNYGASIEKYPIDTKRLKNVLNHVADKFDWDKELAIGHGKGISVIRSFLSYIAIATEVSIKGGVVNIERIDIGIDCGLMVNPDRVISQMEGSIIFGISLATLGEITFENGACVQSNFHDAPVSRNYDILDKINVHLLQNEKAPAGVGEPGVPPVAPAICNAIFDACGIRVRELPLKNVKLDA